MGHKHTKGKLDHQLSSKSMVEQFTTVIKRKKESYYAKKLKPKDFSQMMHEIKVAATEQNSEHRLKGELLENRDKYLVRFLQDCDKYDKLTSFDSQVGFQTEIVSSFFNQQTESEKQASPTEKKGFVETKSLTNLTADDEYNPFLTFLKAKSDILSPHKLTRSQAFLLWSDYKKALNKLNPIFTSHFSAKNCNLRVVLQVLNDFIDSPADSFEEKMRQIDASIDFLVEYMAIYYPVDSMTTQADLRVIFRFAAYQHLLASPKVVSCINLIVSRESELLLKSLPNKMAEVIAGVMKLEHVARYFVKETAKEKADRIALLAEKKSTHSSPDLMIKSQKKARKKIDDMYLVDMLRLSRDASAPNQFLLKGINLGFRDCPYVLFINLNDLETRLNAQLEAKEIEVFKTMVQLIANEMLGSVIYMESFLGRELLLKRVPIIARICDVLRDKYVTTYFD